MTLHPFKSRSLGYKITISLILIGGILLLISLVNNIDPKLVVFGDYIQYWASGRLIIRGYDPYSWDLVKNIKLSIGHINPIDEISPSLFLYPPWSLIFVIPIGYLNFAISRIVWLLANITIIFFVVLLLWDIFGGKKEYRWIAVLIAITFAPTIFVLGVGHFTTLHLLGAALFLYFAQYHKPTGKTSDFFAGFFVSLVTIKLNVLLLFLFSVILWAFIKKRWYILLGGIAFILLGSAAALIYNNQILQEFWNAISNYSPVLWDTPTLGMLFRHIYGINRTWLTFLPTLLGSLWLTIQLKNNYKEWDWLSKISIIILISTVCSPYIWTYDMVVLLIPIIYLFVKILCKRFTAITILLCITYFSINILTTYLHLHLDDFWFFWLAPTYLIWFLIGMKFIDKNLPLQSERSSYQEI